MLALRSALSRHIRHAGAHGSAPRPRMSPSAFTTAQSGYPSSQSDLIWNYSTTTSGGSHRLTTVHSVAASDQANDPLTLALGADATMTPATAASCENTYIAMAFLAGLLARDAAGALTLSPAPDTWTN